MKISFLFTLFFVFSISAQAWWTQKPLPKKILQNETNPRNRVQLATRKIHLYQQQADKLKLVQSGSALILDQGHLLTSLYNVHRFGRFPEHSLYLEQNGQLSLLQVKYLDFYNGVALLYSSTLLTGPPLFSDFDFSAISANESLQLLSPEKKEILLSTRKIIEDGIRELHQIQSSPKAAFFLAGSPFLNAKNKIAGLYLGKIQGGEDEYYLPTAKLSHLFEKAKLTPDYAPDFAAPQRQFLSQMKAFQEKLIQSLLNEQFQQTTMNISKWQIQKLPTSLTCHELKTNEFAGLKCGYKIPFMMDPDTPAFQLELIFQPLIASNSKEMQEQAQALAETYQNQFYTEPTCKQYRMQFKKEDTQFQFCTEPNMRIENTQHSLFRAILRPQKKEALAIILNISGLTAEQTKVLIKPLFLKAEWTEQ